MLILEALHLQLFINLDQVSMNSELSCWIDFNILIKTSYWNKDLTLILYSVVMKFRQLFIDNFVNLRPLTSVSFKFNFTDKVLTELQLCTVNSITRTFHKKFHNSVNFRPFTSVSFKFKFQSKCRFLTTVSQ